MNINEKFNQLEAENTFEVMTKDEVVEFMSNIKNGSHTFGSMISLTIAKMNKTGNPYFNRVYKLSKWSFGCNTSFGTKGENAREKNGIKGDFKPKSTYVTADNGKENYVVCSKKNDESVKYLRVYTDAKSNIPSFKEYYCEGVRLDGAELELVKGLIKSTKKGSANLGIQGADAFGTFNVGLDSVKYLFVEGRKIKVV